MYQADIYFNWNYCIVGSPDYAPDIGEALLDKTIVITFYKLHCGGDLSAPMEYRYLVEQNGIKKVTLGTYSINITNTKEEFWFDVKYAGSQSIELTVKQPFTQLEKYLNQSKHYVFSLYYDIGAGAVDFGYCK